MKITRVKPNVLGYIELRIKGHPTRGMFRIYEHLQAALKARGVS